LFKHPRKKEQRTSTTILISCVEITFREMSVPAIHAVNAFLIKSSALVQKPHMRETETETETVFASPEKRKIQFWARKTLILASSISKCHSNEALRGDDVSGLGGVALTNDVRSRN